MFLSLPYDLAFSILSQDCNALSLSALIIAGNGNYSLRSIINDCLKIKLSSLSSSGTFPVPNIKLPHQFKTTLELAEELQFNGNDNNNAETIFNKLSIVSFFENDDLKISTPSHVELSLWCGYGQVKTHDIDMNIGMLVLTPISSWHHKLVHEWRKFSEYGLKLFPRKRYAFPFPLISVARVKGITATDRFKILEMAQYLNNTNQVLCKNMWISNDCRSMMNIIIMSRSQAFERLPQMNVSSVATKSVIDSITFDYNRSEKVMIPSEIVSDYVTELFVFMEVPFFDKFDSSLTVIKNEVMNIRKTYNEIKKSVLL